MSIIGKNLKIKFWSIIDSGQLFMHIENSHKIAIDGIHI